MRTVCLISDMVNDTPTTKVEMFRFIQPFTFLRKNIRNRKIKFNRWFNSVGEAEQYLEKL
jgi:hypothetical protein